MLVPGKELVALLLQRMEGSGFSSGSALDFAARRRGRGGERWGEREGEGAGLSSAGPIKSKLCDLFSKLRPVPPAAHCRSQRLGCRGPGWFSWGGEMRFVRRHMRKVARLSSGVWME